MPVTKPIVLSPSDPIYEGRPPIWQGMFRDYPMDTNQSLFILLVGDQAFSLESCFIQPWFGERRYCGDGVELRYENALPSTVSLVLR